MDQALKIGILEGDDIGLEVVPETIKVMRAAAAKAQLAIEWHPVPIGRKAFDELGNTLPPGTLDKLDTLDGWVLGPIGHQAYPKNNPNSINPHPILRRHYDLFANIRPSKSYPGIPSNVAFNEVLVDTMAAKLIMKPQQFDVIVTTNTFGDILSDAASALVGGLGLAPGLSAGPQRAMAQATHGSAPDIAGKGIANPYAMIMSGQMLLAWLGHKHQVPAALHAADLIERATESVVKAGKVLTPDLGGTASTRAMGDAIATAVDIS